MKNAFEILKGASNAKTLPEKLKNPVNEKAVLFNDILESMAKDDIKFPLTNCAPKDKEQTNWIRNTVGI